jgi:predicted GNAT family N-acyltransferase
MADITFKQVETIPEFIDAIRIRVDVFILEQGCPAGWDPGEADKTARHYIAIDNGVIVATSRLCEDAARSQKIEVMAVRREYRGRSIGLGLTRYLVLQAQAADAERIWMQAQSHASRFYEKSGFRVISEEYDLFNLGIPHVTMEFSGADQAGWPHA